MMGIGRLLIIDTGGLALDSGYISLRKHRLRLYGYYNRYVVILSRKDVDKLFNSVLQLYMSFSLLTTRDIVEYM